MKKIYLTVFLFSLTLISCTSTYRISDFSSKQKFYEDFNESVKDKSLKIILTNDNIINSSHRAVIGNDSLILNNQNLESIPLNKIREISYSNKWLGIPLHFIAGSAAGFIIGFFAAHITDNNTQEGDTRAGYVFFYTWVTGTIAGIIWGWLTGYEYVYQFNP